MQINIKYFDTFQYICAFILALQGIIGLVLSSFLALVVSQEFNSGSSHPTLMILACINGFLLAFYISITTIVNLSYGGFAFGDFWCEHVLSPILLVIEILCIVSVIGMVLHLYLILIHRFYPTSKQITWAYLGTAFISFLLVSWGEWLTDRQLHSNIIGLSPSKLVCMILWHNRFIGTIVSTGIALIVILLGIIFVAFVYYRIFKIYFFKNGKLQRKTWDLSPTEKRLFVMASSTVSLFSLCWSPYLSMIIYEVVSGRPASPEYDCISILMVGFFYLAVITAIIVQDSRVRSGICDLLVIGKRYTSQKSSESCPKREVTLEQSVLAESSTASFSVAPIVMEMTNNSFFPEGESFEISIL